MSPFKRTTVSLAVLLFVSLPLHEVVDSDEQWPNDGPYVSVILTSLLLGGAMVAAHRVRSRALEQAAAEAVGVALPVGSERGSPASGAPLTFDSPAVWPPGVTGRARTPVFLPLRAFRI
jgi:hypothetical protein